MARLFAAALAQAGAAVEPAAPLRTYAPRGDAERQQGLMDRDSLAEDHGMLFVYSRPQTLSFWMRNTEIPLDIAYISQDGVIGTNSSCDHSVSPVDRPYTSA